LTQPEVLAIIPARSGSKGIPRKNIRPFAGYPLIAYGIAAGLQAETVTRVLRTTDDEVVRQADFVLSRPGGHGVVRELCELILAGGRY
jgi:CMP-N-acetylneuraminic acid synthetase